MFLTMPTGDFELQFKDGDKTYWKSVMITDSPSKEEIAQCVEEWENRNVLAARYNKKPVEIPTNYHWELRFGKECFGVFKKRKDAYAAMIDRKNRKRNGENIKAGFVCFIED